MKLKHKKVVLCIGVTIFGLMTAGFAASPLVSEGEAVKARMIDRDYIGAPMEGMWQSVADTAETAVRTQEFYKKAVSAVDEESDVYSQPDESGVKAGKMYPDTILDVEDKGSEWTKVSSGNVTGYVKTSQLAFGEEAVARANEVCPREAVPVQEKTPLYTDPVEQSAVKEHADTSDSYLVAGEEGDWFKVQDEEKSELYIKKSQVSLKRNSTKAKSVEELEAEEAARKAQEEAKRAAKEAKKAAQEEARRQAEAQAAAEAAAQAEAERAVSASGSDQSLLAALIYCEAGGEPYEGQVAVGAVVLNRVKSGTFPNSIREVIYQSGQFGPAITGKLDRVLANGSTTASCYQAAADALAGSNPIGSALYFGNGNYGQQIGGHWFH